MVNWITPLHWPNLHQLGKACYHHLMTDQFIILILNLHPMNRHMSQVDLRPQYPCHHLLLIITFLLLHPTIIHFQERNHHLGIKWSFQRYLIICRKDLLNRTIPVVLHLLTNLRLIILQTYSLIFLILLIQFPGQLKALILPDPKNHLNHCHLNLHPYCLFHQNDPQNLKVHHLTNYLRKTKLT